MLGFHADTLSSSYYIAEYFSNNNKSMFRIQMTSYEKKNSLKYLGRYLMRTL